MRVEARLHGFTEKSRSADLDAGATYLDLLRRLGIPSESVVVFAGDAPVPVDAHVDADAQVRIVRVLSGG